MKIKVTNNQITNPILTLKEMLDNSGVYTCTSRIFTKKNATIISLGDRRNFLWYDDSGLHIYTKDRLEWARGLSFTLTSNSITFSN